MDIIVLDMIGTYAHFRKFYTNSSSLSYTVPPRTTIAGIIAAILGRERDSYYDEFSKKNFRVGLRKLERTRTMMETINYIKATGPKDILVPKEHTQIPFEIITGEKGVRYRLYINHSQKAILDELEYRAKNKKFVFPPYLGSAPFNCSIDFIDRVEGSICTSEDYVEISTLVNQNNIKQKGIDLKERNLFLVKEKMPSEILSGRVIENIEAYIFDEYCGKLGVKLNTQYINLKYCEGEENILFL